MEPLWQPPSQRLWHFFLGLSHFLILFLDWAGSGTFFFLLWSRAAAVPEGTSVPRGQTYCPSSFSHPRLGAKDWMGLGKGKEPPSPCPDEEQEP